jgi:hypothetical protein
MNMSEAYGAPGESYGDYADYADFSDYADADESYGDNYGEARKRPMRPIAPGPAKPAYQPRPSGNFVTQPQLQAALARVTQQLNANGAAIKAVDTRVRGVATETERTGIALRKESAERKKEILGVRKDLQSTREIAALLPLLTTLGGGPIATFAPLLLLGNDVSGTDTAGSNSGALGGLGGLGGTTGLIALMAVAGGFGKTK